MTGKVLRHTYYVIYALTAFIYLSACFCLIQTHNSLLKRKMFFLSFQRLAQLHTVRYLKTYRYLCMLIILADTPRQ